MSESEANRFARKLAPIFGMESGRAFGRGAAGLFALFSALNRREGPGEIVVPSICCEVVALAAVCAGHTVRIADVSPETLCITPENLSRAISARTRAVVVVHVFGIDANATSFDALRSAWPTTVFVEDIAQAVGGRTSEGALLGGALDFTLLSFADDKILPGAGGMLLARREQLLTEVDASTPDDERSNEYDKLAVALRNHIHRIADLWLSGHETPDAAHFANEAGAYCSLVAYRGTITDLDGSESAVRHLDATRQKRLARHRAYESLISTPAATALPFSDSSMCWRSTFLFKDPSRALAATRRLRENGIHASNHYFPLHRLFGGNCPAAENAGRRLLNLWVTDEIDARTITRTADIINKGTLGHG